MKFDWNELAFSSKKPINNLQAIFIAAPREMSVARFNQIVKTYLPQGNIVLGLAKEDYVLGFENQPQFKMLQLTSPSPVIPNLIGNPGQKESLLTGSPIVAGDDVAQKGQSIEDQVAKINTAGLKHTISTLSYFQRDTKFILEKLDFAKVLFINGSWKYLFHTLPQYYVLATRLVPYELLSPFASEQEARAYETQIHHLIPGSIGDPRDLYTSPEMLEHASQAAWQSYDYGFQTGISLGIKQGAKYRLLVTAFNKVVPFQTYAMHYGAAREANFSPMNDLNYYDTVHAEVDFIVKVQKAKLDLAGTTLFINLLPCPSCARMLTETDICEIVYREDHSDGYGVRMLEAAGKKVKRLVT
ncbi:MAG TPA: deaminase [Patescibacteria group bacterium]|jgi:deoxycytidylate deaminase|nr:deaminase [Patescibacteria group bacterium]